jgi:sphingosine kinase
LRSGLTGVGSTNTRSIPYHNILWAEITKLDLTIHYARPSNKSVRVAYIHYDLDPSDLATKWTERLLDRAYGHAKRRKRIKLLINPFGGTGKATKLYSTQIEPIFAGAKCEVDVEKTSYSGHALEIAEKLDIGAYDVLACASGDGLPHECFNGLGRKPNASEALRKIAVVQLPCGSGNAMSWNLNGTGDCALAALNIVKGVRTALDLVSITQGERRTLSFLSQSLGIVAETDLGTDNVRWMGDARFTYGFLVRLLRKTVYPIEYAVKEEIVDKDEIKKHYTRARGVVPEGSTELALPPLKYGTVNDPLPEGWTPMVDYPKMGNFYCGNMAFMAPDAPFFPASLPTDGMMDLATIDGDVGRMKSVDLLMTVPKGQFLDKDIVRMRKISALRVVPKFGGKGKGYFSVDGEKYPFEPFQIEIHQGLGTVLSRRKGVYEYSPVWEDLE